MPTGTVVLTLAGPLQSWGTSARTGSRRTELYPSKSAVIGMIAGAMGRPSGSRVADLSALSMVVRVDHPGSMVVDYHTARENKPLTRIQTHPRPDKNTSITNREYRVDASYKVFLTGERGLIEKVHHALLNPVYAPFLGRRAAVPSRPVYPQNSRIRDEAVTELLATEPWEAPAHVQRDADREVSLVVVRDAAAGEIPDGTVMDSPVGVREYVPRKVVHDTVTVPNPKARPHIVRGHFGPSPFIQDTERVLRPAVGAHDPFALIK